MESCPHLRPIETKADRAIQGRGTRAKPALAQDRQSQAMRCQVEFCIAERAETKGAQDGPYTGTFSTVEQA